MFKMIQMEWKKENVKKYIIAAIIMTALLMAMCLMVAGETVAEEPGELYGRTVVNFMVEEFTHASYIIFIGVMLAGFIVNSYENKTIGLLFSYPINRKKILLSKIFAVWIFNFTAMVISKILIYGALLLSADFIQIPAASIPVGELSLWLDIFLGSAAIVSISYVALLVGMKMKSSKATIVTAVVVTTFAQGNMGDYSLIYNIPFYGLLLVFAALAVYLLLYNVETKDVI